MKHSQSRFLALLLTAAMTLSSPAAAFASATDDTWFSDGLENFTSTPDENEESETITFSDKENTCSRLKNLLLKNSLQRMFLQILQIHQIFLQP